MREDHIVQASVGVQPYSVARRLSATVHESGAPTSQAAQGSWTRGCDTQQDRRPFDSRLSQTPSWKPAGSQLALARPNPSQPRTVTRACVQVVVAPESSTTRARSRYRILFCAEPAVDALDSSTIEDEDDAGGIY